jgi:hypothetical protein
MKAKTLGAKINKNIEIIKTLEEKAPEQMLKEIQLVRKEQKKYQDFLKKQLGEKYVYIETQSFSTV